MGPLQNSFPTISCVTAADCLGIEGSSSLTTGSTSVATSIARWNGLAWKRAHVALPKGTRSADLYGVSCKGAKSCLGVGDYYTSASSSAASRVLALTYNGTSLKPAPTVPLPRSTTQATLSGVSCTTATHCVAVGTATGDSAALGLTGQVSLIETWNGTKWTPHTVGSPGGTVVEFTGISCVTSAYCVLAGESFSDSTTGGTGLYLRPWDGRKLTVMKPAAVGNSKSYPLVTGVSCATLANCAVSGAVITATASSSGITAFIEVWNGTAWQRGTVTWPKGTTESLLFGVSCSGAHTCDAVGLAGSATAPGAAAVSYNGTSGGLQPVPAPAKGRMTVLTDVSCLSAARCAAVGETGPASATTPSTMTGVWNGTTWKLDPGF